MPLLSVGPVSVSGTNGGNFNRYWYANNNPYTFIDPDGRLAQGGLRQDSCSLLVICSGSQNGRMTPGSEYWLDTSQSSFEPGDRDAYEEMPREERAEFFGEFSDGYEDFRANIDALNHPGPSFFEAPLEATKRFFRRGISSLLQEGLKAHSWDMKAFSYEIGKESLEAYRKPPYGQVRSKYREWSWAKWRYYDFGEETATTVDFYYYVGGKSNRIPSRKLLE